MASQSSRTAERAYHQDYIARIRYENTLPPPPGAPKLLDIPIDGVRHYTSAAFASRLARQQPLNIEADAELGMPIDLVGMPGIFEGDESAIQAPLSAPPIHPKDKALLRPLSELGKPKFSTSGHSFLRRTEYISSDAKSKGDPGPSPAKGLSKASANKFSKRQSIDMHDEPTAILRHVIKGFDIAYPDEAHKGEDDAEHVRGAQPSPAEIEAWKRPRHPSKSNLKLLDSYPVLPDLEAITDSGSFVLTKFQNNPANASEERDERLDVALLNITENDSVEAFNMYLPDNMESVPRLKRKFDDVTADEADDDVEDQYQNKDGQPAFKYVFQKTFESVRTVIQADFPYKDVAMILYDPADDTSNAGASKMQKAAYFYPIGMRIAMKAKRSKKLAAVGLPGQVHDDDEEEDKVDEIDLVLRAPDVDEEAQRQSHREEYEPGKAAGTNGASAEEQHAA